MLFLAARARDSRNAVATAIPKLTPQLTLPCPFRKRFQTKTPGTMASSASTKVTQAEQMILLPILPVFGHEYGPSNYNTQTGLRRD